MDSAVATVARTGVSGSQERSRYVGRRQEKPDFPGFHRVIPKSIGDCPSRQKERLLEGIAGAKSDQIVSVDGRDTSLTLEEVLAVARERNSRMLFAPSMLNFRDPGSRKWHVYDVQTGKRIGEKPNLATPPKQKVKKIQTSEQRYEKLHRNLHSRPEAVKRCLESKIDEGKSLSDQRDRALAEAYLSAHLNDHSSKKVATAYLGLYLNDPASRTIAEAFVRLYPEDALSRRIFRILNPVHPIEAKVAAAAKSALHKIGIKV